MTSITSIPIAKQNSANPIIRFMVPPKKAYIIIIYAFLLRLYTVFNKIRALQATSISYSDLFTESFSISSISFPAAFFASGSTVSTGSDLPLEVNLFTKSGTISKIFVTPS